MYRATANTRANTRLRREGIAEAARQQIAVGGFGSATVKAVADRAHCSAGLIYQYFANADDLLKGAFAHISDFELAVFHTGLSRHDEVGDAIATGVEIFIGRALAGPQLADALLFEALPPMVEEERLLFRRKWAQVIAQRLDRGVVVGQIPLQNTGIVSTAITGALSENLLPRLHSSTTSATEIPMTALIAELQILCRTMIGLPSQKMEDNHDNISRNHPLGDQSAGSTRRGQ